MWDVSICILQTGHKNSISPINSEGLTKKTEPHFELLQRANLLEIVELFSIISSLCKILVQVSLLMNQSLWKN